MKKKYKCVKNVYSDLEVGKVYELERESEHSFFIENDRGKLVPYPKCVFEEVKEEPNVLDEIRKELKEAKELVAKNIFYGNNVKFEVGKVGLHINNIDDDVSFVVEEEAKRKGYCVYVRSVGGTQSCPYKHVVVQDYIDIVLNEQYSAKVYKDKVVVGCQTFAMDKVKEILDAGNKLK